MTMVYRLRWRWLRLVAWYYWTFWRRDYLLERMWSRAQACLLYTSPSPRD